MSITPELLDEIEGRAKAAEAWKLKSFKIHNSTALALVAHVREVEKWRDSYAKDVDDTARVLGERYLLDPPDGGDVKLHEGVQRLMAERDALTAQLETDRRLAASELSHVMAGWKSAMERAKSERDKLAAKLEEAKEALREMIYETTNLSPREEDGSHWCNIKKTTLERARTALSRLTAEPAKGGEA